MTNDQGTFNFEEWRVGEVYYMGDPHFGHDRIRELCGRPYASVEEMNEGLLDGINSTVSSRNTLVIAGDVLLGKFEESVRLLKKIRAKRIWILPGNHDRWSLVYGHHGSAEVTRTKREMFRLAYEEQRKGIRCEPDRTPSGWSVRIPMHVGRRTALISHYPYVGDSRVGDDRFQQMRPRDVGIPLIHGHVHGAWQKRDRMFNVGVDVNDFKPVHEGVLGAWLEGLPLLGSARPVAAGL
jgi:calcineurin-like phosphoesterase family protein